MPNGNPILSSNVTFKIEIRDKAGSCVLYSEIHSAQDLSQTKGAFSLLLGAGSSGQNFISSTTTLDAAVFKNPGVIAPFTGCASGLTFAAGDERVIRVYYDTGAGLTAMTPDVPVVASAYAMVAETLQGKSADEFVTVQGTAAGNLNQANLEYSYSLTNWQRLKDLIDGVSSSYLPTAGTGTFNFGNRIITGVAAPGTSAMDAVNKGYADAYIGGKATDLTSVGAGFGGGQAIVWDQAQNKWVTGSATDASKLPLAGGTMSGDITMAGNDLFSVGDIIMNVQKKLQLGRFTDAEETALVATLGTAHTGMTWYNTTDLAVKVWNGSAVTRELTVSDTGTSALDPAMIPATGVTAGTYGSPSTVPVFTVGADGRLTVAYGTAISGVAPGGAAGGDLTGTYPNPSIAAAAVTTAKLGDNAVTAAKIKSTGVAINRLIATDPVTPNNLTYFECSTANDIIAWTASGWACTTVSALSPVKTVASKTPDAAGNVALTAYDITGIESAATKDYGTAAGNLVELDGTGKIPASLLPASAGSITAVTAEAPLLGGGTTGNVTVSIDVGTGANQVVRLNGSAQIPAVDGSLLTGVNASKIGTRTVSSAAPTSNYVLTWNGSQWEPSPVSGALSWPLLASPGVTSAGAPSYSFSGDTDTGMYSPGAGTASFATNGTARLTIDSVGFVGIGTTAPTVPLHVIGTALFTGGITVANLTTNGVILAGNGAAGAPSFRFFNDADTGFFLTANNSDTLGVTTGGVERMRVNAAGLVAIGGTTPAAILDVSATGTNSAIVVPRDTTANRPGGNVLNGMIRYNTNTNVFEFYQNGGWTSYTTGSGSGGDFYKDGSVAMAGAFLATSGGAATPSITFSGDTNTGMYRPGADEIAFSTHGTARLKIADGFVQIWGTSPLYLENENVGISNSNGFNTLSAFSWSDVNIYADTDNTGADSEGVSIYNGAAVGAGSPAFRVAGGKVGIGITVPNAALDISVTGTNSALIVPRDTTANRPAGNVANGMVRYNTNTNVFEFYQNGGWTSYTTGSGSGGDFYKDGSVAMTGAFLAIAGSGTAPGMAFASDPDTGLYLPGIGTAAFATNGTARMMIHDTGGVSVGTSLVPLGRMVVQGSTTPTDAVHFGSNPTANNGYLMSYQGFNMGWNGSNWVSRTDGVNNGAAMLAPEYSGDLHFYTFPTTGSTGLTVADASVNANRRMTVYRNGTVGIGVAVPQALLDVKGTGAYSAILIPRDTTAQRPTTAVNGMIRYNSNTNKFEFFENNAWVNYGTGSGSASTSFPLLASPATTPTSAASYSFSGDADTGMHTLAADKLALTTAGTARLSISANGDVGFGTTTPTVGFSVATPQAKNAYFFYDNANVGDGNDGQRFYVYRRAAEGDDFVGIYTDAFQDSRIISSRAVFMDSGDTAPADIYLNFLTNGGTHVGNNFLVGDGYGSVTNATLRVHGYITEATDKKYAQFQVNDTSNNFELTRQDSNIGAFEVKMPAAFTSGNVGIGTASPGAGLDVASTGTSSAIIVPRDTTANRPAGNVANGMIRYNTNSNKFEFFENGGWVNYANSAAGVTFPLLASPTGSAPAPAYSFSGDSDTGMYQTGVDWIEFATGGVGRLSIGNSRITSAIQFEAPEFRSNGNGSAGFPSFYWGGDTDTGMYLVGPGTVAFSTNGTARMAISPTGAVGIGTTNPLEILHVAGGDARIDGNDGGVLMLSRSDPSTNADDVLGVLRFGTSDGNVHRDLIAGYASEARSAGNGGAYLVLNTVPNGTTTVAERLRITSAGNVGIGTNTPSAALDVAATGAASAILIPRDTTANRPTAANGMIRYNTNSNKFEFYENGSWTNFASSTGGGTIAEPTSGSTIGGTTDARTLTGGSSNTAFGYQTLHTLTTGQDNTVVGASAGRGLTTGSYNVLVGQGTGFNIAGGLSNVLVGNSTGTSLTGSWNVALGGGNLVSTTGNSNTAIGVGALSSLSSGSGNIALGASSGNIITTGNANIMIGGVNPPAAGSSNRLNIGDTIYGDLSSGTVSIGTSAGAANVKLDVNGQVRSGYFDNSNLSIDWSKGNIQTTSAAAGTINFTSSTMYDGASYILVLTSAGTFTLGVAGDVTTWRCLPACSSNQIVASGHTILTILKVGTTGYVSWSPGY